MKPVSIIISYVHFRRQIINTRLTCLAAFKCNAEIRHYLSNTDVLYFNDVCDAAANENIYSNGCSKTDDYIQEIKSRICVFMHLHI